MQKQTVVLVNPPHKRIVLRDMYSSTVSKGSYNWPCVDLLVLSGVLRDAFEVRLMDANTEGWSLEKTVHEVRSVRPCGICFAFGSSVRDDDYLFVKRLRERLPSAKIVGTGGLLYHRAEEELRQHPEFDACLRNFVTGDIARYFRDDPGGCRNIVYRKNGDIVAAPLRYPDNGFAYGVPLHCQLPLKKYCLSNGKRRPLTSVLTSFGCPGRCSFCVSGDIEYRYRDPRNVLEELREVRKIGVREIVFRDNVFCADKQQGRAIMELMLEHRLGLSWVAETRADVVDEETAGLMKRSGCHALHIGAESASVQTLARCGKGITLERIKRAFAICRKKKIQTVGYFIMGLPGETIGDMRSTVDLAVEMDCDYASFNVLMPIAGTPLREEAEKNGWLATGGSGNYDGSFRPLVSTPEFSREEVSLMVHRAYRQFYFRPRYLAKALRRCTNLYQARMLARDFVTLIAGCMHE